MSESFVTVEEPPHALINDFVRSYFHAGEIFNMDDLLPDICERRPAQYE
jgi:hypothetical protein